MPDYKEISSKDFKGLEKALKAKPSILLIYAEWCGHCKMFKPTWKEFTAAHKGGKVAFYAIEDSKIKVLMQKDPELLQKLSKDGQIYYPKIVAFSKGKTVIYEGEKSIENLNDFYKKVLGEPKKKPASKSTKKPSVRGFQQTKASLNEQIHGASAKHLPHLIDQMIAKYLGL